MPGGFSRCRLLQFHFHDVIVEVIRGYHPFQATANGDGFPRDILQLKFDSFDTLVSGEVIRHRIGVHKRHPYHFGVVRKTNGLGDTLAISYINSDGCRVKDGHFKTVGRSVKTINGRNGEKALLFELLFYDFIVVEVKVFKEKLKIKEKDIEPYDVWNKHLTLFYFFYSVIKNTFKFVSHAELKKLLPLCEMGQYPDHTQWDNKMYYKVLWSSIK